MAQVKWVFEKDAYQDGNTEKMIEICKQQNWLWQMVNYVMYGNHEYIKWDFHEDECVIAYGSIGFVKHIQRHLKWYPGAWCEWHQLKTSTYLAYWGEFSVQQDYAFLPLAEVKRQWVGLWGRYSNYGNVFLRPDDNDKRFHGELVCPERFDEWWKTCQIYSPPLESMTMISRPNRIQIEFRLLIVNRKVVTGSHYRTDGLESWSHLDTSWWMDKSAVEFAEKVASSTEWQPSSVYVMDVCMVEGDKFKLLEIGSFNCAGLYKCDLAAIMAAVNEQAFLDWSELQFLL